jgi:DHA2 family multidrug resistance protein
MTDASGARPSNDGRRRASLEDWLAVAAGCVGALMAVMDISIVNSSLPVIQGEIGATSSEGTWIGTAYLVAEIVIIPLTAWLQRILGLRRLLLVGSTIFTLFSMICGLAPNLGTMIFGRLGQGLAGGVLIPTAVTIIAQRLPRAQQSVGLAIIVLTSLVGPAAGPLVGGWLTENLSWHFAFFVNAPIWLLQIILLLVAVPPSASNVRELRHADWFGVAGMVMGLGAVTTLLEEGHREQWFESALIWKLAAAGLAGVALVVIGQLRAPRAVIRLSLLRNRDLGAAVALLAATGVLLYSGVFLTPQFVVAVAGYTALQAGLVAFIGAVAAIPTTVAYPAMASRMDGRLIIALGLLFTGLAALLASRLAPQSTGSDLVLPQLLFGAGTTLSAVPLQQIVIGGVPHDDVAEVNSLAAVARNLGGSMGLAGIASIQDQRLELHHWRLASELGANNIDVQTHIADSTAFYGGGPEGLTAAYRILDQEVLLQALVMTYDDLFFILSMIAFAAIPLLVLLRPSRAATAGSAMF